MTQPPPPSQSNDSNGTPTESFYDSVGGEETFRTIVHEFYKQVPGDDILGPMYPADDLAGAEQRLLWFLEQYWGGPNTYNAVRGHPRLRMRHFQFTIDEAAAQRWLRNMKQAMDTVPPEQLDDAHRAAMWDHMQRVAMMLINTDSR